MAADDEHFLPELVSQLVLQDAPPCAVQCLGHDLHHGDILALHRAGAVPSPFGWRSPAEGRWHGSRAMQREDIAVMEVMAKTLDRTWWSILKNELRDKFRQEVLI